jgi:hypothetical protein
MDLTAEQFCMMIAIHSPLDTVDTDTRSAEDQNLLESARTLLNESGYPALAQLGCSVRDGVVSIEGKLPTYYLKQVAQEALLQRCGARGVNNQTEVCWSR